jgi:ureidoacrylate peracid hydrolase
MPEFSDIVEPSRAALVVIDMQNDFCDPEKTPMSVPMLPRLKAFIAEARRAQVRVIYAQVLHDEATESEVWNERPRHPAVLGTPGADFHPDFVPEKDDYVIKKSRYSAFIRTTFEDDLHAMGIETLIMTGIATNVCVESTARDAYQRDFRVVMVEDCCASMSEEAHEATLNTFRRGFGGLVCKAEDVIAAWPALTVKP